MSSAALGRDSKKSKVPEQAKVTPASTELDDAEIAARAYSYWESRGFQGGSADEDWVRAIEELEAERAGGA